jgi:hypothetical protein
MVAVRISIQRCRLVCDRLFIEKFCHKKLGEKLSGRINPKGGNCIKEFGRDYFESYD